MLPFKTYTVGTLLVLLLGSLILPYDTAAGGDPEGRETARFVLYGYLASSVTLILLGLVAAIHNHDRRTMWSGLAYGGVGLLLAAMVWPGAFPPHTRM
jgi:FtsH-binding integral membrane protein